MNMSQIAIDSVNRYLGKGLTKDVAVGIVAVLWAESGLNPGSQGTQSTEHGGVLNPNGAYGLASWNGPRQQALASFAKAKGIDPAALNTQLDFVLTEAANSYPAVWAAIRSSATKYPDMVRVMVDVYENPADKPAEIARAMAFADTLIGQVFTPAVVATPNAPPAPATQGLTMDPAIIALLAPLAEAVIAGLARGLIKELLAQAPAATQQPLDDIVAAVLKQIAVKPS